MATERLTEYVSNRGITFADKIDREKGVIPGVKILGLESKNGRKYLADGVRAAKQLYEGAPVNIDHPAKPGEQRRLAERFGNFQNVSFREGQGLFGDLHYNPKHALAEQVAWDAEHAPHRFGASHNVSGKTRRENGALVVESVEQVHSVDLVADPATTNGLFEAEGDMPDEAAPAAGGGMDPLAAILDSIGEKIVEIAKSDADLSTKKAQIVDLLKKQDKIKTMLSDEKPPAKKAEDSPPEKATEAMQQTINSLTEQVAILKAKNEANERERLVETKLAGVPKHLQSAELRKLLTEANNEGHIDRLVKTITEAAKTSGRPVSRGPNPITEAVQITDTKSFIRAIT